MKWHLEVDGMTQAVATFGSKNCAFVAHLFVGAPDPQAARLKARAAFAEQWKPDEAEFVRVRAVKPDTGAVFL